MNAFLTAMPAAADEMGFIERITEAGVYALLGMFVIFIVLGILLVILTIFNKIFGSKPDLDKIFEEEDDTEKTKTVVEDDGETVAAITAAVAMMLETEAKAQNRAPTPFRVVAFRRTGNKAWNENNN